MRDQPDVLSILADHDIRVKDRTPGRTTKTFCPKCRGGRTREQSLSVTIDADGGGVAVLCHRGTCGWKEGWRVHAAPLRTERERRPVRAPAAHTALQVLNKPAALYKFFALRGIEPETVDAFGLYVTNHYVPTLGERPCIVFPYVWQGTIRNRKYRPPEKHPQAQEKDAVATLYNVDAVTSFDRVVWVEGEPDCLAIHQAGYPQVVSLKDGATKELRAESDPARAEDRRFGALETHAEMLGKIETFILAGDLDEPGLALREELCRRLGRHRCLLVRWPQGCKDACDVLGRHGAQAVRDAIEAAAPYPLSGMHRLEETTLVDYWRLPPPRVMRVGVPALDAVVRWPGEGRLIVVTGFASAGKSSFTRWVMIMLMQEHARKFVVFSPEMQPWEDFALSCAEVWAGKTAGPLGDRLDLFRLDEADVRAANDWLRDRLIFLASDAEENPPTVDWLLERTRSAALRFGVTDALYDPWNEIEHARGLLSETDYISRTLQRMRAFGMRHGINVWLVAHPAKPAAPSRGRERPAPITLYDIAGSAAFANKSDLGLVVHAEGKGEPTRIILAKSRFRRWGRRGDECKMDFEPRTGRFSEHRTPPNYEK